MSKDKKLDRRDVVRRLVRDRGDTIFVASLGAPCYDLGAAGDHDRNFYLWGAMGGASMVGLGLALAQPDLPVVVLSGDGETLMGMGGFATIAVKQPRNLSIVILDNELYGETGSQRSHTAWRTDLAAVAKACGISDARLIEHDGDVDGLARDLHKLRAGPLVAVVKIDGEEKPRCLPSRDGVMIKGRVRQALGFETM
jgi:thiamine pyrophosphate-dependent acetolactate synthase large subunit-like protein